MKTTPMTHQTTALAVMAGKRRFALGPEQGTGKTWITLADVEEWFRAGKVNALLVVTLNGVHDNWVLKEIPAHLEVPHRAVAWVSGAGKKAMAKIESILRVPEGELAILTMNIEGINTIKGNALVKEFMRRYRVYMAMDESQIIKNPGSKAHKTAVELGDSAVVKRILSGTLVADKPLDLFGQYEFLGPGLLGTTSYRAFVSRYAVLLPPHHPLVQHAKAAARGRGNPQIVARDDDNQPLYRNLEELKNRMRPITYRVLKRDCLDLPEKVYQTHYFDLEPAQRRVYEELKNNLRIHWDGGDISTFNKLAAQTKLQQVTSGYIMVDGEPTQLLERNPRTRALKVLLEQLEGSAIVWARYHEEIQQISDLADSLGMTFVQYYGDTPKADRIAAIDAFQAGEARLFIATEAAARGLTLTKAETAYYYSNSFKREIRVQSEDRCHRKGTVNPVVYIDLVAKDTIDEAIVTTLQNKTAVADFIMEL